MIKLYFGPDSYSLNQELRKLEQDFSLSNFGEMNIIKAEGSELTLDQFVRSVSAIPFLSDKRLFLIRNFLSNGEEKLRQYLADNLEKLPDSTEIILVEDGEVNKNSGLYKKLAKKKLTVHFPLRQGAELENWLLDFAGKKDIPINREGVRALIVTAGNNSWRLTNELEKLDLFRQAEGSQQISPKDVEFMVASEHDQNIFDFIDSLGARNSKLALRFLHNLFASGKNENYILSMIIFQFRNMLLVEDLLVRGVIRNQIPTEANLHPFVVGKTIRVLKNYDLPLLKRIYWRLSQTDLDIKTGRIEPKLALEKLLADLTL